MDLFEVVKAAAIQAVLSEYEAIQVETNRHMETLARRLEAIEHPMCLKYLDAAPSDTAGVYLIHDYQITGLFKIGKTTNGGTRVTQISRTIVPIEWDLGLVHFIKCKKRAPNGRYSIYSRPNAPDMDELEKALHNRFNLNRVTGEWHCLDQKQVRWITSLTEDKAAQWLQDGS